MDKRTVIAICLAVLALVGLLLFTPKEEKIRVGWQVAWATQGQIAQSLKHSGALENNSLQAEFKAFNYGGPMVGAALSKQLDVVFLGDLPALILLSKSEGWTIVGRLFEYNDGASLMVPLESGTTGVEELAGKKIAVPFGSGPHVHLLRALEEGELPASASFVNLDVLEIIALVQANGNKSWGGADAVAVWEPAPALLERKKLARRIANYNPVAVIVMSNELIEKKKAGAFLKAVKQAWLYYAENKEQANEWYRQEANIKIDSSILNTIAASESNLRANEEKDVNITLSQEQISTLAGLAETAFKAGLIKKVPDMEKSINQSLLP
ncbi:ABC transporter substrate-binding protein [Candidatus Micrarchaeota archaeon]|nr:ABC transporter substrate-binding protein [Candidatus Micrarchaeota archaeon]